MPELNPISPVRSTLVRGSIEVGAVVLVALSAYWVYRPALAGYFFRDDFDLLAIARFLDDPLRAFYQEHTPGGLFFRPLGLAFWWFTQRGFGAAASTHYLCNLVLHIGVALALRSLIVRSTGQRALALAAAWLFALHPLAIGTTLWLADRFDLLAALFGLLALRSAIEYCELRRQRWLIATLSMLLLALAAKEVALALLAPIAVLWIWPDAATPATVAQRVRACLWLLLPPLVWLGLRSIAVEHSGLHLLLQAQAPFDLVTGGLTRWATGFVYYLTFTPKLTALGLTALVTGALLLGGSLAAAARTRWSVGRTRCFAAGLALCLGCVLVQTPIMAQIQVGFAASGSATDLMLGARFYYLALAGLVWSLCAVLAAPTDRSDAVHARWRTCAGLLALVVCSVPLASAAHRLARGYGQETPMRKTLVDAAIVAIEHLPIPARACQIYLLGTQDEMLSWNIDAAVKALSPDVERIAGCLIQTEHTPWYHLVGRGRLQPEDAPPMTPLRDNGVPMSPTLIGGGELYSFNLSADAVAHLPRSAQLLEYRNGSFEDVTIQVLDGSRQVHFACNRQPPQCL